MPLTQGVGGVSGAVPVVGSDGPADPVVTPDGSTKSAVLSPPENDPIVGSDLPADPILVADGEGYYVDADPAALTLLGYTLANC